MKKLKNTGSAQLWTGGRLFKQDWCRNWLQGYSFKEIGTFNKNVKNTASAQLCTVGIRNFCISSLWLQLEVSDLLHFLLLKM